MAVPDRDKLVYERLKGYRDPAEGGAIASRSRRNPRHRPCRAVVPISPNPWGPKGRQGCRNPSDRKKSPRKRPLSRRPGRAMPRKSTVPRAIGWPGHRNPRRRPTRRRPGQQHRQAAVASVAPPVARFATRGPAYRVQLVAVRSEERARAVWRGLVKKHDDLLGSLRHDVVRADLGGKGVYYRLRAGLFADKDAANFLCAKLKALKVGCITVKAGS